MLVLVVKWYHHANYLLFNLELPKAWKKYSSFSCIKCHFFFLNLQSHIRIWDAETLITLAVLALQEYSLSMSCLAFSQEVQNISFNILFYFILHVMWCDVSHDQLDNRWWLKIKNSSRLLGVIGISRRERLYLSISWMLKAE